MKDEREINAFLNDLSRRVKILELAKKIKKENLELMKEIENSMSYSDMSDFDGDY